jgi:transposase-like protein/predicted RNA-binding Zn-ribbon protein involved in translation (DUF1610 family)
MKATPKPKKPHDAPTKVDASLDSPPPATEPPKKEKPPYPTSLLEFTRMFPTDRACSDYLFRVRWPDGVVCPKCGSTKIWRIDKWRRWECRNGHQTSITAGTTMHRTKQPLQLWFFAAFLVGTLTPGISALQFQKQLGLSRYETAFQMLHKLRSALIAPDRTKLKGVVEVNEGYIGGPEEGHPGRGAVDKAMVILAVEVIRWKVEKREKDGTIKMVERVRAGRLRMSVIPNGQKRTLIPWVQASIEEGSTVYTDGLTSYHCIPAAGYKHVAVIPETGNPASYLYMVHLIMSNVKAWLLGTFHGSVSKRHLPAYLNEYVFRFNRRFWPGAAFHRSLGLAMHAENWPEYETLYDVGRADGWVHPHLETDPYTLDC